MENLYQLVIAGKQELIFSEYKDGTPAVTVRDLDTNKTATAGIDFEAADEEGEEHWNQFADLLKFVFRDEHGFDLETRND